MKVNVYFLETGSHLCLLHRHLIKAHFLFYYLIPNYLFYHFDRKLAPINTPFAYPRGKQWAPYATTDCPFLNLSNLNWLTTRFDFDNGNFIETGFQLTLVIVGDSVATTHRLIFLSTFRALTKGQISTFNTNGMVVTRPFATRSIRICRIIQTQGMITNSGLKKHICLK